MKATLPALAGLLLASMMALADTTLEQDFQNPPMAAKPHVWWHWLGSNVSREGIVRDLKAMREFGIGGCTIFNITAQSGKWQSDLENSFNPKMQYHNEEWFDLVKFAAEEAKKNGLELGIHNCPGFSVSGGPWITPELGMKKVVWSKAKKGAKPPQPPTTLGFYRDIAEVDVGDWTYRFGYTCTGARPQPVPEELMETALEADKLSAKAMTVHMENVIPPLKAKLGPLFGTTLRHILLDSYEAGNQNWTEGFREYFTAHRGYDPVPWLPVLAGEKLANGDRFQEDLALTVQELFTENHFKLFHDWTTKYGVQMQLEPYGGPFDVFEAARYADLPMVEFWGFRTHWMGERDFGGTPGHTGATGRACGRTVIATEAFTGMPAHSGWTVAPRHLKRNGDATYARGVNRLTLHHWVHQPFDPQWKPGMTMGWWGTHFGDCQTWYEPGKEWGRYLGRCQALLQRGEQVVDMISLKGAPKASEYDSIPESMFLQDLKATADGGLELPSGRKYKMLRFRSLDHVSPEVMRKLKELMDAGVKVWGVMPQRAYGLRDFPQADAEVQKLAAELAKHPNLVDGWTVEEALAKIGVKPGFKVVSGDPDKDLIASHRREGDVQFFFVCNSSTNAVEAEIAYRVTGKLPEYWYPVSGKMEAASDWRIADGVTTIKTRFEPLESRFVVFRQAAGTTTEGPAAAVAKVQRVQPIEGAWRVTFEEGRGAPQDEVIFAKLQSLSEINHPGIKYFSGEARYLKQIITRKGPGKGWEAGERVILDLGEVKEIAEVFINGKRVGVSWYPPFRLDITDFLQDGGNDLLVKVTNTWANRMIGDKLEPEDVVWDRPLDHNGGPGRVMLYAGRGPKRIPDFVLHNTERPSKGRYTFAMWDYFGINSDLLPAGLLGPVKLEFVK